MAKYCSIKKNGYDEALKKAFAEKASKSDEQILAEAKKEFNLSDADMRTLKIKLGIKANADTKVK